MKFINGIFYLEFQDLVNFGCSYKYLTKVASEYRTGASKSWDNISDPADNRKCLINYDGIPAATLIKYNIPPKEQLINAHARKSIRDYVKADLSDLNFFLSSPDSHDFAHEYAKIAAWLHMLAKEKNTTAKSKGFSGLDDLYSVCMQCMNEEEFKTWKINNLRVFKRRLQPFNQLHKNKIKLPEALSSLVSKNFGIARAAKLGPEQQALLIQLYSDTSKPNFEQVYAIYLSKVAEKITEFKASNGLSGWSEKAIVSLQTIKNYLTDPECMQLWYAKRHGFANWRQKFDPIIKRIKPSFANALWVMDGTPWHRYYMDGKSAYARLNVFPILDAYSWCIIGYAIDFNESTSQVVRALHGACKRAGVMPYQLQYDNGPANKSFKSQAAINALVKYNTATQVGNARAKIIEPFFKHFNDQVLKFRPGYAGSNITAKKLDSHANREELTQLVKSGQIVSLEQALQDMNEDFKIWNNKPFNGKKSPLEAYRESFEATKDQQRIFTHMHEVDAFWEMPGSMKKVKEIREGKLITGQVFVPEQYTFTNEGLQVQRGETTFDFDVENAEFRAHNIGQKFNIKYDPERMDKAYLYINGKPLADTQGNMLCALEKSALHMAIVDKKEGEGSEFHRLNNLRKEQFKIINDERENKIEQAKLNGTFTPVTLDNLYPKEIMNAAKVALMEDMIHHENVQPPAKTKALKKGGSASRFDLDPEKPFNDIKKDDNKPTIDRWD